MRKVHVNATVLLTMRLKDGVTVDDAVSELEYIFNLALEHGDMLDTEIVDFDVKEIN